MKFKTFAIIVVVAVIVAAIAYNMGVQQTAKTASTSMDVPPVKPAEPTATAPGGAPKTQVDLGQQMPPDHGGYDRFVHFKVGNRNVKSMYAEGNDVWIGTSGGVVRYNITTDQHVMYNIETGSLLSNGVFHVSKYGDRILVGTYGGGMSIYDPEEDEWENYNIPQGLADQFVYDAVVDDKGDVWIATWSGANRVRGGKFDDLSKWDTFTVKNTKGGLPNDWVYGVEKGKNGEIWFGTEGGLARYKDGKWQKWTHKEGLGAKFETVKDDIKFTSDPGTASKHHARQKVEQGLENVDIAYNPNYIISMVLDRDGNVWCGTWGAGLSRFDGKTWKTYTVKDGLPANHIFMLSLDDQGALWIGTNHGLAKYKGEGKGFDVRTTRDGLYSDNVFSMTKATDGSVWVGSFGGVARLRDFK